MKEEEVVIWNLWPQLSLKKVFFLNEKEEKINQFTLKSYSINMEDQTTD